jgi:hypothetical protein
LTEPANNATIDRIDNIRAAQSLAFITKQIIRGVF